MHSPFGTAFDRPQRQYNDSRDQWNRVCDHSKSHCPSTMPNDITFKCILESEAHRHNPTNGKRHNYGIFNRTVVLNLGGKEQSRPATNKSTKKADPSSETMKHSTALSNDS